MLPSLSLARLRFIYRLRDPLPHAAVQGSLWRGALGYALKSTICVYADPFERRCPECALYRHCPYPRLFEPVVPAGQAAGSSDDAPRPFVLEPPLDATTALEDGAQLVAGIVLLGPALEEVPTIIRSAALLGERGLGQSAARATLTGVDAVGLSGPVELWPGGSLDPLPVLHTAEIVRGADWLAPDLTLRFVTPTRLRRKGAVVAVPDAETITRALLRRLISLAALYGEPWYPETHRLIAAAAALPVDADLDWRAASHLSTRHNRRMPLDGFEGELTLHAVPEELRALLLLGSFVHLGKLATYGHGWYLVE
ncbi:MAG TPA: hypothetical protein DEP84_03570 [Chloroflexi bacterium]|nr:hypothetical protein [Chloroflexota bacterium]